MTAQLADFEWLTSAAAEAYLARCEAHLGELTRLVAALRKELSHERAHLVVEQAELRRRAQDKFSRAHEMFFTRQGLEQATDETIARYKAARFHEDLVIDVCCGIGGDLAALAMRAQGIGAAGIERDPSVAHLAATNVERLSGGRPLMRVEDARTAAPFAGGQWHMDPDRRATGARATHLAALEPSTEVISQWLEASGHAALKLAPATEAPEFWTSACQREWIGSRGECRQQVLWFGDLARRPGRRTATVVEPQGTAYSVEQADAAPLEMAEQPGRFLYEPHAAVLAAALANALAAQHTLQALTPEGGYLTGDARLENPAIAGFEVADVLPFDLKQLKAYFRERHIGRLEIKKRGIQETPEQIRQQLGLRGDAHATLIIARTSDRTLAMIARRLAL